MRRARTTQRFVLGFEDLRPAYVRRVPSPSGRFGQHWSTGATIRGSMPIEDRTRLISAPHAGGLRSSEVVLSVLAGPDTGRLVTARGPGAALRLGRGPDNDLVLHDDGVSRQHAIVEAVGGKLILRDLESTNGTIVNGVQVRSCEL